MTSSERHALPAAVLWDMDGTLVDTEPYWMRCEYALAERYGGRWSEADALAVVGGDLVDSATYMREHMGIDRTPAQIVDELLDGVVALVQEEVPWRPGARELLADLGAAGVPCGPINTVDGGVAFAEGVGLEPVVQVGEGADAVPSVRNPIRFSETPPDYRRPPPRLDQHGEELRAWLSTPTTEEDDR